jgi:hypothetical protein
VVNKDSNLKGVPILTKHNMFRNHIFIDWNRIQNKKLSNKTSTNLEVTACVCILGICDGGGLRKSPTQYNFTYQVEPCIVNA